MPGRPSFRSGLSPRLRGNHTGAQRDYESERSIPAPAGEPATCVNCSFQYAGLSPRLRGNHGDAIAPTHVPGSIPAPAGEPIYKDRYAGTHGVYPRACGGTPRSCNLASTSYGLSPRLRGNQIELPVFPMANRSIPAPAGEPAQRARIAFPHSVYPRACGGTLARCANTQSFAGLSPRLRGNLIFFACVFLRM